MRNYTHFKGRLSKIEFDKDTGEFVATSVPVMPEPDPAGPTEDAAPKIENSPIIPELPYQAIAAE